jgi:predicted Rossmann fold nucleotide-binding protein DprA/Smf involved in DNA uptake
MGAGARSDDALAALLLTTRLGDADEAPLAPGRFWSLVAAVPEPSELFATTSGDIARRTGFPEQEAAGVERLLAAGTNLAFALERSERQGFLAVTPFDAGYPQTLRDRLGDQAPPVLFTVGARELLSADSIGVVGSRAVSREGEAVAREVARRVARDGLAVVSGGAKGVDRAAMSAAHEAGGRVVGYVADSLVRRVQEPSTRRALADGATCLATPFDPSAGSSAANAIGRNKLIYASARVTLVVASDLDRGGTWEGATEALRRGYGSVAVWVGPGAGPGNERLAELGATPVDDVASLLDVSPSAATPGAPEQLPLDL